MSNQLNEYVKKPTTRRSDLAEVMDRMHNEKIDELEDIKLDAKIAEEKKKILDSSPAKIDSSQATNFMTFLSSLFVGKSPLEIKEIIRSFTQEDIDKLTYMARGVNQNSFVDPRGFAPRDSNSEVKNMLEALKIGLEAGRKNDNGGISTKDLLDALKTGAELSKAQQPPIQPQQDPMAVYKMVQEIVHPFQQASSNQEKQMQDIRMKELESRIVDPVAYVKNIKSVAADLGFSSSGATNEYTLKKAEMDQKERLETRKLDWEEKKWSQEQEGQGKTIEQIKDVLKVVGEGPIGRVLENLGSAGADKLRGPKTRNSNVPAQPPQIAKVKCPNCAGDFSANTQLSQIQCPLCGVQLQSGNQPAPQQEQQSSNSIPQESVQQATPEPQPQAPKAEIIQEKPVDQTVEVESPVEQITDK